MSQGENNVQSDQAVHTVPLEYHSETIQYILNYLTAYTLFPI